MTFSMYKNFWPLKSMIKAEMHLTLRGLFEFQKTNRCTNWDEVEPAADIIAALQQEHGLFGSISHEASFDFKVL